MMNLSAINQPLFEFIRIHADESPTSLLLKIPALKKSFPGVDIPFAIIQIECRKKNARKLPKFVNSDEALFPSLLAAEQSTAEAVAKYHASLVQGDSLLDMTAGLGIDTLTMSDKFNIVTALEIDPLKVLILKHNTEVFDKINIQVINTNSVQWINDNNKFFSTIFIDPARRDHDNKRLYQLSQCIPDVIELSQTLLAQTSCLMIKASPMLDITNTLKVLPHVNSIRCVSLEGECKEVLIECKPDADLKLIEAVGLKKDGTIDFKFGFDPFVEFPSINYLSGQQLKPGMWLYEPDASVMKIAPWGVICQEFSGIAKLGVSSHLFTSDKLFPDFPGRKLRIKAIPDKKTMKKIKGEKLNVVSRDHPESPEMIRRKFNLKEGSDSFLYATKIDNRHIYILADR